METFPDNSFEDHVCDVIAKKRVRFLDNDWEEQTCWEIEWFVPKGRQKGAYVRGR